MASKALDRGGARHLCPSELKIQTPPVKTDSWSKLCRKEDLDTEFVESGEGVSETGGGGGKRRLTSL